MDFSTEKGAIWSLVYYNEDPDVVSNQQRQAFLDNQSREMSSMFDPPKGLSPSDYSLLYMQHILKTRSDSNDLLDKNVSRKRISETFQIGNKECMDEIVKIETSQFFHSWENPELVKYFIELSQ